MALTFQKVAVIVFLVFLVLGFTVPGIFFVVQDEEPLPSPPQPQLVLCRSDADCTLTCAEQAVPVLCYRNTCQQARCDDVSPVGSYGSAEHTVTLRLEVGNQTIAIADRFRETSNQSYITKTAAGQLTTHATLTLAHVLDKLQIGLNGDCLFLDGKAYCRDKGDLTLLINGQANAPYADYVVQDGDDLLIKYTELSS